MTQLFKEYEEQFITSISTINKKIDSIATLSNNKKELAFNDIKADLSECDKYLKLMETDIAPLQAQSKFDYLRKVRQYKRDYDNSRKNLHKTQQNYALQKNKEMLIGAQLDEGENGRSKFIGQGELLSDTTYKLKDGVRVLHQTFQIGNNVQTDLYDHTGRLIQNRKKLGGANVDLGKSGKLVGIMMNRIRRNKFVLFSILAVIFLVIIIIAGVHFAKKKSEPAAA